MGRAWGILVTVPCRSHPPLTLPVAIALVLALQAPRAWSFGGIGGDHQHLLRFQSLTALQWNPLGVQTEIQLGYRYRLYRAANAAFKDNFISPTAIVRVNPAFMRIGAALEVQPLTVLTLRAAYEHRAYYGSSGMLQSFPSASSEHSDLVLRRRGKAEENYRGTGHQFVLQAVLRAKVGPVVLLNDFAYNYFKMNLWHGDTVFYAAMFDTLVPGDGGILLNSLHLFFAKSRFLLGVRYTAARAFYDGGEDPNTPSHRVGPMVVYSFKSRGTTFKAPTLVFILNWWLKHRYRAGQAVHQAVPYGALAFQFTGDLWTQ